MERLKQDFAATHDFWHDRISLTDPDHFDLKFIRRHNQLADLYLLGLCQHYSGRFVTFDKAIEASLSALVEAPIDLIRILK